MKFTAIFALAATASALKLQDDPVFSKADEAKATDVFHAYLRDNFPTLWGLGHNVETEWKRITDGKDTLDKARYDAVLKSFKADEKLQRKWF